MATVALSSGRHERPLHFKELHMKTKINPVSRWMTLVATLILPLAYFTPIWSIKLWAPQYPEGLEMQIWIDKLSGSVKIINGLNHYIGMANIEESMFPEFSYLKYVLAGIIALGVLTFIFNRHALLQVFTFTLIFFAVAAMVDMYIWGYRYGHNLDPHAAIKIEGASYQPPLIGYKQLLNFTALSIPDIAGWGLFGAGFLMVIAIVIQWRKHHNEIKRAIKNAAVILWVGFCIGFSACSNKGDTLHFGQDDCSYCGMKLVDDKFGAMIITDKGKAYRFDDVSCMFNFKKEKLSEADVAKVLVIDFSHPGNLIDAKKAHYLRNEELKSPMGGNAAAFQQTDSLEKYFTLLHGEKAEWNELSNMY